MLCPHVSHMYLVMLRSIAASLARLRGEAGRWLAPPACSPTRVTFTQPATCTVMFFMGFPFFTGISLTNLSRRTFPIMVSFRPSLSE